MVYKVFPGIVILFFAHLGGVADEIKKIPVALGLASHPVNGGHCLISDKEHQYIAFYDEHHRLTIGKRELTGTEWDFVLLPEQVGWDSHNKVILFQDRDGYLHVTGNMHNAPLNYYRTEKPYDIHTFKALHTWAGMYEDRVTYPTLTELNDGGLLMMYRHGQSGNGMRLLVRYDENKQTWVGTGEAFISGMDSDPTCNAYPFSSIVEDRFGNLHIAWCWRETPDVVTNFNVCYAKSADRGITWTTWSGKPLPLPMRPDTAETVDWIPQKSGLINGGSLVVDRQGIPYIGYTKFDENGCNQMYIATPENDAWRIIQATDWTARFWFEGGGTIPEYPPIPRLSFDREGRVVIRYAFQHVQPNHGEVALTRDELLAMKPGQYSFSNAEHEENPIRHVRAVNRGPLPIGVTHYMVQETAPANRDRKPENPKEPTMIYILEIHKQNE